VRRLDSELQNTWWHWSPPQLGGGVWSCGTCDYTRALLSWEAGSGAVEHMVVPEPSSADRRGLELQDM
jgi:hypothetical protein